jgi:hypothetical protein
MGIAADCRDAEGECTMRTISKYAPALLGSLAVAMVLTTVESVQAGPPLICHRFDTGGAPSLPWGTGDGWDAGLPSYDISRLTADTLRLLTPAAPIRARMETLRRATLYAARDPRAARELLATVLARALDTAARGKIDADALFDAGYLVESYRQASHVYRWNMLDGADRAKWVLKDEPAGLDGYAWVLRAASLAGDHKDMAYAASLMKDAAPQTARR